VKSNSLAAHTQQEQHQQQQNGRRQTRDVSTLRWDKGKKNVCILSGGRVYVCMYVHKNQITTFFWFTKEHEEKQKEREAKCVACVCLCLCLCAFFHSFLAHYLALRFSFLLLPLVILFRCCVSQSLIHSKYIHTHFTLHSFTFTHTHTHTNSEHTHNLALNTDVVNVCFSSYSPPTPTLLFTHTYPLSPLPR
jgi:hypothetical protein